MYTIDLTHWKKIRKMMEGFPETTESTSYGTPAFKVKKKLLLRLKEDGETMVVHSDDRDIWMNDDPAVFFVTDHYLNYPYVLVRLKKIRDNKLRMLIEQSWKEIAPKLLLNAYQRAKD